MGLAIGGSKIKKLYCGGVECKKAYLGNDLVFEEQKPSRLPNGYTEVEYIHLSGTVGFQTNYRATPSRVRILFDIQMEAFSGNSERLFYQYGKAGLSTVKYYFTLTRFSEVQFRVLQGVQYGTYTSLPSGSVTGERILIDANILSGTVAIGEYSKTISAGLAAAFSDSYLYIGCGSSDQYAPTSNLYSCKIYVSGTLKFDFVPCTDSSGTPGLFDLVGGGFYANSFDGTVTAGPAV